MRLDVQGPPGEVAHNPEEALSALADIAEADGAVREEWLAKAMAHEGATGVAVPVAQEPRHQVVEDATAYAVAVYTRTMFLAKQAINQRLEQAVRDADTERYRLLLPKE